MAWQYPLSSTTTIDLGTTDNIFVGRQTAIAASNGSAVSGSGSDHNVIVSGTLSAYIAIRLGDDTLNDGGQVIDVRDTGHVFSGDGIGVMLLGSGNTIKNAGKIEAPGNDALYLEGFDPDVITTIDNSGEIIGSIGVFANGTQDYILTNTGTIESTYKSYYGTWLNTDTIVNSGVMIGDIGMGQGDDSYDGRLGTVRGAVHGDNGADTIYGGKAAETLYGDAGADKIMGAGGADMLSGGTDADTFIYRTGSARDTIMDFETGIDKVDMTKWRALDNFADIKSHASNHGDDVWIKAGSDVLILENMHKADLQRGDFLI